MPFSNYLSAQLVNHTTGKAAFAPPATLYVGLSSTLPARDGTNITPPVEASYARVAITQAEFDAALEADPSVAPSISDITFPTALEDWGAGSVFSFWTLHDAATAGNFYGWAQLTNPGTVLTGVTFIIPAGQFALSLR